MPRPAGYFSGTDAAGLSGVAHTRKLDDDLKHLLDEVRVALPGIQILFAFLLVAPFNRRFELVDDRFGITLYCCALACAAVASILLIAPSVQHRLWSAGVEHEDRRVMLAIFDRCAIGGGAFLSGAIAFSLAFVGHFLFGGVGALVGGLGSACVCGALWYVFPFVRGTRDRRSRAAMRSPGERPLLIGALVSWR